MFYASSTEVLSGAPGSDDLSCPRFAAELTEHGSNKTTRSVRGRVIPKTACRCSHHTAGHWWIFADWQVEMINKVRCEIGSGSSGVPQDADPGCLWDSLLKNFKALGTQVNVAGQSSVAKENGWCSA